MGFVVGGAIAAVGAVFGSKKAAKNAWHARNQAQVLAWKEQVANENAAKQQADQVAALQADQQAFETERQRQQEQFALDREAAANQAAQGEQNQQISDLTPTVELTSNVSEENSAAAARKRRASFRPEYTSGVTI